MKHSQILLFSLLIHATLSFAIPCAFDNNQNCILYRDILNDKTSAGLNYYGATNYDHRISGEINIFDAALVLPYADSTNIPGQIKLVAKKNTGWKSGEIMTRADLDLPPYYAPVKSAPFTTKEVVHGYLEVVVKMPKCETSDDGLCQRNTNPASYNSGLWPAIWLLPTMDTNWPQNGEIDIAESYQLNSCYNTAKATLHFNGNDGRCGNNDCRGYGYHLGYGNTAELIYANFHTWGFEWQPDPNSTNGGIIMTGYFDNLKIWGPVKTDSLPSDGPNAFNRGFNDPAGGFYLITALAVGGPFAGGPNPHLQSASMFVRSIKAYNVGSLPPPASCNPPSNIQSMYSNDKKQITLSWQEPENTDVKYYQVHDYENKLMWAGTTKNQRCFIDSSLPGRSGMFTYFLYTNCGTSTSSAAQVDVNIP